MNKERELLRRISSHSESRIPLHFIKEIQQLVAQPEQEPVAWHYIYDDGITVRERVTEYMPLGEHYTVTPLYTAPAARKHLTGIEISQGFKADDAATHPYSYWAGVNFAEKHHGIGGEE